MGPVVLQPQLEPPMTQQQTESTVDDNVAWNFKLPTVKEGQKTAMLPCKEENSGQVTAEKGRSSTDTSDDDTDEGSLVYATCMPIRLEAMHSLEHPLLRVWDPGCPNTLLFACPLCDERFERPRSWKHLYEHYLSVHWSTRRYVGQWVCFPCRQNHTSTLSMHLVRLYRELHEDSACHLARRKRRRVSTDPSTLEDGDYIREVLAARLDGVPEHFHCPACEQQVFLFFDDLVTHCKRCHPATSADPNKTPTDPGELHAPLLEPGTLQVLPLTKDENVTPETPGLISKILPAFLTATTVTVSDFLRQRFSLRRTLPLLQKQNASPCPEETHEQSVSNASASLKASPSSKRKSSLADSASAASFEKLRKVKRVRFNDQVLQIGFDKERSRQEKCGSSLGNGAAAYGVYFVVLGPLATASSVVTETSLSTPAAHDRPHGSTASNHEEHKGASSSQKVCHSTTPLTTRSRRRRPRDNDIFATVVIDPDPLE